MSGQPTQPRRPADKPLAPGTGVVDRLRDVLTGRGKESLSTGRRLHSGSGVRGGRPPRTPGSSGTGSRRVRADHSPSRTMAATIRTCRSAAVPENSLS
ncbi:hypothetical protein GCM10027075_24510 [Streptomyces heilongjiangensis]